MNKAVLFVLCLFISLSAKTQVNYVLNPDFEQYDTCPPRAHEQINTAKYWSGLDTVSWSSMYVPEYRHVCTVPSVIPDDPYYYQFPRSGSGFAQMQMFSDETSRPDYLREYLQGRLYKKLIAGKSYCVSFYVNLEEISLYAIKEISAYFDNGIIDTVSSIRRGLPQTQYTPQFTNSGAIISDTAGWTKIEGSFIATGAEQFITIGNFRTKANTTYLRIPTNSRNGSSWGTEYLIDDVSVIESDLKANAGPDTHVGYGDSVYIGIPNEIGLENSWTILGDTTVIGTEAGIWVKPMVTTSYVVSQTLCGITTSDTVRVEVWKAGITSINGKVQSYTLSPNPSEGLITLYQLEEDGRAVNVRVYNAVGSIVYTGLAHFKAKHSSIDLSNTPGGLYHLLLQDGSGTTYKLQLVKQ